MDGDVRKKDGKPLEIVAVIPAAVATSKQETELMQNMLAQVGVKLTLSVVPSPDFFSKYITPGQFDFTVFSWIGTPYPMSSARSLYAMPTKNAAGELDVQQNYARIGTPEIDQLFDGRIRSWTATKAAEIANQLDALIWQEVHSLTLYQRPELSCASGLSRTSARSASRAGSTGHRVGEGNQETNVMHEARMHGCTKAHTHGRANARRQAILRFRVLAFLHYIKQSLCIFASVHFCITWIK